jgi:hypothetical protein
VETDGGVGDDGFSEPGVGVFVAIFLYFKKEWSKGSKGARFCTLFTCLTKLFAFF